MKPAVIALPGGVNPAGLRYAPLLAALSDEVDFHLKDLEVYAGHEPPADYSIQAEVEAVSRFADSLGLARFHLLGYSGGGFISLAFAGAHPERLHSLALFEPASVPGRLSPEEAGLFRQLTAALAGLSGQEFMRAFMRIQLRPGVELSPPAGPPPPWMQSRPAGLAAMLAALGRHPFNRERLRRCDFPVFLAYGDQTGEQEAIRAGVLAQLLPDLRVRRFPGIHHFVAPEDLYTEDHVRLLRELWTDARNADQPAGEMFRLEGKRLPGS